LWTAHRTTVRRYPLAGLNAVGNPVYRFADATDYPAPAEFTGSGIQGARDVHYVRATDTVYLSGFQNGKVVPASIWQCIGNLLARYDHFSTQPKLIWSIRLSVGLDCPVSIDIAGDRLFVGPLAQIKHPTQSLEVYATESGAHLSTLLPGPEVAGMGGWIDIRPAVRAFQRQNGEYLVFVEDDGFNKVTLYRGDMRF
jgi:hypothetical protein